MEEARDANQLIQRQLQDHLEAIEGHFSSDCLTYSGPIAFGADDYIRNAIEVLKGRRRRLVFILETPGGFAEVARRISDILRHHYQIVNFLIPSHAMSAGTILAMSGNSIWMDYYSVLGPIDPQVPSPDGNRLIPALGYLLRYEELLAKANAGHAGAAELQILLEFDQGDLYSYEQARDLSVSLLEEWLAKYKFRHWKKTEGRGVSVTTNMKKERAVEIAQKLNDIKRWNSHGIGINMQLLRRELKLKIDDFGEEKDLNRHVRSYHKLLIDYMRKRGHESVVQTRDSYEALRWR